MSFACHIWEYPAPRSSAEVDLIFDTLSSEKGPQNPRFIELARRLTAKHPCITTLEDDELEERGVWSDGPLDGVTDEGVYSIGIRTNFIDTVFPFVCKTANELGLNVHEIVAGSVHRPDGRVLEFDPKADDCRRSSTGVDLTRLSRMLMAQFEPLAAARGFRRIGHYPVRGFDGGWQSLGAIAVEAEGRIIVDLIVQTYLYDVMRLVHELDPERRAGDAGGCAFGLSAHEFLEALLEIRDPADVIAAARALKPIVESRLLPVADECTTLAGLDRVMNTGRTRLRHFPLNHLVVARLADNVAYDALYARMRELGHIDDALHPWLSATRERLAMRLPSSHETILHGSIGPKGPQFAIVRRGK